MDFGSLEIPDADAVDAYFKPPGPAAVRAPALAQPSAAAPAAAVAPAPIQTRKGPDATSFAATFGDLYAPVGVGGGGGGGGGPSTASSSAAAAAPPPPDVAASVRSSLVAFTAAAGAHGGKPPPPGAEKQCILVSPKQRGNPVLTHIKHVLWTEAPGIAPDYMLGRGTAALFLSLRYHSLNPAYLHRRLRTLADANRNGSLYRLVVVLVHVDVSDAEKLLLDVTLTALAGGATVVCAFSVAEAARYLETYKAYEHKPASAIQERSGDRYLPRVQEMLTHVRSVNKTDVLSLLSAFGSVAGVLGAPQEALGLCPGFGEKKVARLWAALHAPLGGRVPEDPGAAAAAAAAAGGGDDEAAAAAAEADAGPGDDAAAPAPATAPSAVAGSGDVAGGGDDDVAMAAAEPASAPLEPAPAPSS